jgi:hypothetical protein
LSIVIGHIGLPLPPKCRIQEPGERIASTLGRRLGRHRLASWARSILNLAARLCAEAKDGQILISGRVAAAVEKVIPLEDLRSLTLNLFSPGICWSGLRVNRSGCEVQHVQMNS